MHFEIRRDTKAGYYLYVWENGRGLYDYLQDTLEIAKNVALKKFQVPLTDWKQVG